MSKLENKIAIVTGAASGIGKAIATLYAKEGATVVVSDLNLEGANEVTKEIIKDGGQAMAIKTDVASEAEIKDLFKKTLEVYGRLDILVNNAGIMDGLQPVGEVQSDKWDAILNINTTSVMKTMREAINIFLEQGHGVIVNDISIGGLQGTRAGAAYTASKHATVGLTLNTAYMYADNNIRCNGIAPGVIETNISSSMDNISDFGLKRQSLGLATSVRSGRAEEVATVAVFLGSDDSSFVNGEVILTDGGWSAI